jgi:filamentous hemagglutinin family protein
LQYLLWGFVGIGVGYHSPVFGQVTPGGSGTVVNRNGQEFNITGGTQAGRNLFHTFQQFGLGQGQVASFFSNPAIANILARVNGGSASYINGLIQVLGGNSNLFLMNPAGIVFGPNASLNVPAAFTATTADRIMFPGGSFNAYGNNDYSKLVGEPIGFAFDRKETAAIINEGKLAVNPGQSVSLIAGQVINTGTIQTAGGNITIAAVPGENLVRLSQAGQLLSLEFNPQQAAQMADAQGNIPVTRLPELLTGGGVTSVTVNGNDTVTVAGSRLQVPVSSGTAIISGTLDVASDSAIGGSVGVFGSKIAVVNGQINASGITGGGEILIGGELQGKGSVPNAQYTFISSDSKLLADAINAGDGGRVIVWADKVTQFWGTVSAKGGEISGNGGFVEVSGKEHLNFQGSVDTSAPQGKAGTLLLDPENIIVGGDTNNDAQLDDNEILFADDPGATFKISTVKLNSQLGTGNVILQATNNVTFDSDFEYKGVNSRKLTIEAGNDISTQAITTNFYEIGLDFTAGNTITVNGEIVTGGGAINFNSKGNITTQDISTSSYFDGGAVSMNSKIGGITTGSILANASDALEGSGGAVALTAAQNFIQIMGSVTTKDNSITITHGGNGITPFIVGNATTNGSTGILTTESFSIAPTKTFLTSTVVGNISILTGLVVPPVTPPESEFNSIPKVNNVNEIFFATIPPVIDPNNPPTLTSDAPNNTILDTTPIERTTLLSRLPRNPSQILLFDQSLVNLFARFLNNALPINSFNDVEQVQLALGQVGAKTNTRPALVYLILDKEQLGIVVLPPKQSGVKVASTQPEQVIADATTANAPLFRSVPQAKRADVEAVTQKFLDSISDPRQRNTNNYRQAGQQLYEWMIAPIEAELKAQGIDTIMFVPDEGLRTLPFAALWDGQQFLVEKFNLGQVPSVNLVNFDYQPVQGATLLAMGASEFKQQEPLKGVPIELGTITDEWGGKALLNEEFTINNLIRERQQNGFLLLHLATHAEFRPSTLRDAYLEFWNERLTLDQVRRLPLRQPPVELLVLSACRTALGDPYSELGFAGLAVASGVKSALASSWYVSDVGTVALMTEFYQQLQSSRTKAQALRETQIRIIRNQVRLGQGQILREGHASIPSPEPGLQADLSHPYYWAGFTLIGSPW